MIIPSWAQDALARGLTPGRKIRIDHDCGDGNTLLVNHDGTRLKAFCFRCKSALYHGFELTLSQRLEVQRQIAAATLTASATAELPGDPSERAYHPHDWPPKARLWLYRAGFNDEGIRELEAFWSAELQRVVIPFEQVDGTDAWIARSIDPKHTPKYLFPAGVKRGMGAVGGWGTDAVILVEDYLSAVRVAKATGGTATVIALNGTSADNELLLYAREGWADSGVQVLTWLDPDEWGQKGAATIRQRLARYDVPVINVVTDRDPKFLTTDEIQTTLLEAL